MEDKIRQIQKWLGTGSINIFGIQFSGKDTLGIGLAKQLDANFLSSGDVVRAAAKSSKSNDIKKAAIASEQGVLTPTDQFRQLIVPHLQDPKLSGEPLILSSVGRWYGEEEIVMSALHQSNHDLKAVFIINIPEEEVWNRWRLVRDSRNGGRVDDIDQTKVERRIKEFYQKTSPVIDKYRSLGLAIDIDGTKSIDQVRADAINQLYVLSHTN